MEKGDDKEMVGLKWNFSSSVCSPLLQGHDKYPVISASPSFIGRDMLLTVWETAKKLVP